MAALEEPARLPRIDDFRSKKRRKLLAPAEQVAAKGGHVFGFQGLGFVSRHGECSRLAWGMHLDLYLCCCWPAVEADRAVCAAASSKHRSSGGGSSGSGSKPKPGSGSKSRHSGHGGSQPKAQPLDKDNKQVSGCAQPVAVASTSIHTSYAEHALRSHGMLFSHRAAICRPLRRTRKAAWPSTCALCQCGGSCLRNLLMCCLTFVTGWVPSTGAGQVRRQPAGALVRGQAPEQGPVQSGRPPRRREGEQRAHFCMHTGLNAGLGQLLESGLAIRTRVSAEGAVREHLC
jgi:hypothetical protein